MISEVLIIGAGGHGQVIADILVQMQQCGDDIRLLGFLDDDPALHGKTLTGLPVLGGRKECSTIAHDAIVVAIGNNIVRKALFNEFRSRGEKCITAQHPRAIVAPGVTIGIGAMIAAGVVINTASEIGDNVILNTSCTVDHHCYIGAHSHIGPGAHVGGNVTIHEEVLIGIGAIVMPGITIHSGATIGAGSLVRTDVPGDSTVVGVPARLLR